MAAISLNLPDDLLEASGACARALQVSRAEYIRRAIERMNRETRAQLRAGRLVEASRTVREESMRVNAEFAAIERDPDAE
jgi:metal-responsive CopG/Arc/MetJ family transcriptional regulator